jgi:hypothetical protein
MVASRRVEIDARFQGIPAVALGGYVGGLLAGGYDGGEVTLRRPVPLGKPLAIEHRAAGTVVLLDGDEPLATLDPAVRLDLAVPGPVTLEEASAASSRSLQRSTAYRHPFPDCLVCGAGRAEGDGVRLFAGPVAGRALVAAPWTPHLAFADAEGNVLPEFVWAVLDCPTIMALVFRSAPAATDRVVTARLAVATARCSTTCWPQVGMNGNGEWRRGGMSTFDRAGSSMRGCAVLGRTEPAGSR